MEPVSEPVPEPVPEPVSEPPQASAASEQLFALLDTNGDGVVTKEEWSQGLQAPPASSAPEPEPEPDPEPEPEP